MMTMREYLETYDPNTPASFLTVGDVLAIYEKYADVNPAAEAYQMEHEAEESTADEWLSHLDTNSDPRTPEQRDLDEWQAEASDVGYGKNGRPR